MGSARGWWGRFRATLRPNARDEELEQELRSHLELAAEDAQRRGATVDDATRGAVVRAGHITPAMDAMRDQQRLRWLDDVGRDVRYAARTLRRSPSFTLVVLLTLAIGIGANAAVFGIVNGVLLKPLPYPDPDRLVAIWQKAPGAEGLASVSGDLRMSSSMFFTYSEQNRSFENLGIWYANASTVTGLAEPEEVRSVLISHGTLQALAVQPLLGRWLSAEEQQPNAAGAMLISYGYWQRRFGGDPSAVGRRIIVNASPREIVGVMPEGFRVVDAPGDLFLPLQADRSKQILPGFGFEGVARMKPGVTIAEADADIARLVPIWMRSWPAAASVDPRVYESWGIAPALRPLKEDVIGGAGRTLTILMGSLAMVLLIACANVATLLLVRAEGRQQELAVRAALGAGSSRIVRALLIESVLLGLVGGLLGLGLAYAGLRVLVAQGPASLPRLNEIDIDGTVVAFTVLASLASGIVFGLIPALKHMSPRIAAGLSAAGRSFSESRDRHRARDVLVVGQLALALVLLISSGLMIRSVAALRAVDPGFTGPERLQTLRLTIPGSLIKEPEQVMRAQQVILEKLAALPGVESSAFVSDMALDGNTPDWDAVMVEGVSYRDNEVPPFRIFKNISPGSFVTAGTRLIAGRDFTWTDLYERRRAIMVSENLAREVWGSASAAIGKRVRTLPAANWREVIGVVQDVSSNGLDQPAPATIYWPAFGESEYRPTAVTVTRTATFIIRSSRAGTNAFLREVQEAVWSVNSNLALASVRTMREVYDRSMARTSFTLVVLVVAACMALTLGVVGIYGVVSYAVSRRRREIGIRVALGAPRETLTRLFVASGLKLAAIGLPIGLIVAALLTRMMSALLFGVSALDPVTFGAVPVVLTLAAIAASYLPARRAASVDPVEALKGE